MELQPLTSVSWTTRRLSTAYAETFSGIPTKIERMVQLHMCRGGW